MIDVFFAGLMLICLEGQHCPKGDFESYPNTAWVVKADGQARPCGRKSPEKTKLEIQFSATDFGYRADIECDTSKDTVTCPLEGFSDLCLERVHGHWDGDTRHLPRLGSIDTRFKHWNRGRLKNRRYVPKRIHFAGKISAGPLWPNDDEPTTWYRSDSFEPSFRLSDSLKLTLDDDRFVLTDCRKRELLSLQLSRSNPVDKHAEVVLRNRAEKPPARDLVYDDGEPYEVLSYLLWYYRLGRWGTFFGRCPNYTGKSKPALLRCKGKNCAYDSQSDTVFWPVMAGRF